MFLAMKQRAIRLSVLVLLAALALPSVGPLFDHHFAERQPGHVHVAGATRPHTHSYEDAYHHHHGYAGYNGDAPIVVNYDNSLAVIQVVTSVDLVKSFLLFEPTSYFNLPPAREARPDSIGAAPPDIPPRAFL